MEKDCKGLPAGQVSSAARALFAQIFTWALSVTLSTLSLTSQLPGEWHCGLQGASLHTSNKKRTALNGPEHFVLSHHDLYVLPYAISPPTSLLGDFALLHPL